MVEMREAFGLHLVELGKRNDKVYVLDADVNTSTRIVHFLKAFPKRFVQAGIAEQNMVGIAAGLANEGKIPIACTLADFLTKRAMDQISISVAYPRMNVKLAGAYPGLFAGKCGATHQSVEDLACMRAMPDMRVVAPADITELKSAMDAIVDYCGPVYFRVPRMAPDMEVTEGLRFEWGKGHTLAQGDDITLISTGIATQWTVRAAQLLKDQGVSCRVLHMPSVKPFDEELTIRAARETGVIVTVENHSVIGGLGSAVCEITSRHMPVKVIRMGIQDRFGDTADDTDLIRRFGLTPEDIARTAIETLA